LICRNYKSSRPIQLKEIRLLLRFIRRENVKHYRQLLEQTTDEDERQRIMKLLAEEEKKQRDAGDKAEA
jgi:ribosomal protein L22